MNPTADLLAALSGRDASPTATRWATDVRSSGAAPSAVATALAEAPTVSTSSHAAWRGATLLGIVTAGLATARAIHVMNEAPGMSATIPWWLPLVLVVLGILTLGTRRVARPDQRARQILAARAALSLRRLGVPPALILDAVQSMYALDAEARRRLSDPGPRAPVETDAHFVLALARSAYPPFLVADVETSLRRDRQKQALGLTAAAAVVIGGLFLTFLVAYLQLLDDAFLGPAGSTPSLVTKGGRP